MKHKEQLNTSAFNRESSSDVRKQKIIKEEGSKRCHNPPTHTKEEKASDTCRQFDTQSTITQTQCADALGYSYKRLLTDLFFLEPVVLFPETVVFCPPPPPPSTPKGGQGMSDVSPLSGISGLSFDSPFLSPLLFFCLVLLLFLSCRFSAIGLLQLLTVSLAKLLTPLFQTICPEGRPGDVWCLSPV